MKVYNKLVRDNIPRIIEQSGKSCVIKTISEKDELIKLLEAKLSEELEEYRQTGEIEEIADIIEVLFGLSEAKGTSPDELMEIARAKRHERGGFKKGIFLVGVNE